MPRVPGIGISNASPDAAGGPALTVVYPPAAVKAGVIVDAVGAGAGGRQQQVLDRDRRGTCKLQQRLEQQLWVAVGGSAGNREAHAMASIASAAPRPAREACFCSSNAPVAAPAAAPTGHDHPVVGVDCVDVASPAVVDVIELHSVPAPLLQEDADKGRGPGACTHVEFSREQLTTASWQAGTCWLL